MNDNEIIAFLQKNIENNVEEVQRLLSENKQQKINGLLNKSGLNKKFKKRTFDNFEINDFNVKAYNKALDFVHNFSSQTRGLLFTGGFGTGKTHLAASIANYLISQLYPVMFGNITNIISSIRSTYHSNSQLTEENILEMLTDVEILIIDDLGKENTSSNTRSLIYQIINRRYEEEKLIVATTNLNSQQLTGKIDAAAISRLYEMCQPVKLTGPDWRVKHAGVL